MFSLAPSPCTGGGDKSVWEVSETIKDDRGTMTTEVEEKDVGAKSGAGKAESAGLKLPGTQGGCGLSGGLRGR